MEASIRPWFTSSAALVSASVIAMTPIAPITVSPPAMDVRAATAAVSTEFQLTALDIPYILTLPVVRQYIRNWAENWGVYLAGLAKSGVGLVDSLLSIPGVTVEIIQEVLALDFVGAFDTFTSAVRDSVVAVGQPLLDSLIWRNEKFYAVQTALQSAVPQAFIDVTNGFLVAANGVTTSLIVGTQNLVAAILTLNLGAIVDAVVDGTANFIVALGAGAGAIVGGIEDAQLGIATALATDPPSTTVEDVSGLRTLRVDTTISPAAGSDSFVLNAVGPTQERPTTSAADLSVLADSPPGPAATSGAVIDGTVALPDEETTDVTLTDAEAEPQDPSVAPVVADSSSPNDNSDDAVTPAGLPKTSVGATTVKDAPKTVEDNVKVVTAGAEKDAGVGDGGEATNNAGAAAKSASDADDK